MYAPTLALAAAIAAPSFVVEPADVVLGDVGEVELVLRGPEVSAEHFALRVEAGAITEVNQPRPGELRARWLLPTDLMPRRLAAAAIDTRSDTCALALLAVSRRARLKVTATPEAEVRLRLGGAIVATGKADAGGHLALSVPVPPAADLTSVEQEVMGRADAAKKLQELGVRNAVHAWLTSAAQVYPDGQTPAPTFLALYRDDGTVIAGAEVALASSEPRALTPAALAPGLWRADVTAGPFPSPRSAPLEVLAVARLPNEEARAHLVLPVLDRKPARLEVTAPPFPWRVGEVYEVFAAVYDEHGGLMPEAGLEARLELDGGGAAGFSVASAGRELAGAQRLLVTTPKVTPTSAARLAITVASSSLRERTALRVEPRPAETLLFEGPQEVSSAADFHLVALDRFGNQVPGADPEVSASAGRLDEIPDGEGLRLAWRPSDARRSEVVRLQAALPSGAGQASTTFLYRPELPHLRAGVLAGVLSDGATVTAPAAFLHLEAIAPELHEDLSLSFAVGAGRATRSQPTELNGARDAVVERSSFLLPATAIVQWRLLPVADWALRVGAGAGVLVSSVGVRLRSEGEELVPEQRRTSVTPIGVLSLRLGYSLGLGELELGVRAWDAITTSENFARRPRAMELAVGYSLDLM